MLYRYVCILSEFPDQFRPAATLGYNSFLDCETAGTLAAGLTKTTLEEAQVT
jgi:hypothetical protein